MDTKARVTRMGPGWHKGPAFQVFRPRPLPLGRALPWALVGLLVVMIVGLSGCIRGEPVEPVNPALPNRVQLSAETEHCRIYTVPLGGHIGVIAEGKHGTFSCGVVVF